MNHQPLRRADFGFRNSDFGFSDSIRNPKSAIRHWRALLESWRQRKHSAWSQLIPAFLMLLIFQVRDVAAQTPLHEAFESIISDYDQPIRPTIRRPIVNQAQWNSPIGADRVWQPQGAERRGQLRWGARLAQAEMPQIEVPPSEVPQAEAELSETPPPGENLPPPAVEGTIPLAGSPPADAVEIKQYSDGTLDLIVRDYSLSQVLAMLAQTHGLNIVAANDIDALISITLRRVPVEEALTAILSVANYTWVQRGNIILVTSLSDPTLPADVQDRQIQVFELDFASAVVVAEAVSNFLSPVGKVSISASDPADNRRARELVVVEDLPSSLARIAAYIQQIDCPPRQVQIEAHVLQVTLSDECRCGVDLHALFRIAGSNANIFSVPSLASGLPGSGGIGVPDPIEAPAAIATFAGHDLQAVIEALQTTTDSKTLGSPKLLVVNGQQAHIQVGETIYYSQTTTTETSSQQGAASVETGVILRLTPRITQDGRVLLRVEPQVSNATGERPSEDLPPNIARIELQSDVMLRDGEGMIIGGLIDERDVTSQTKVPYLGDVKGIGWLFRKSTVTKERTEILFALVPRIQPYDAEWQAFEQGELIRAGVPLLHGQHGPLKRAYRPWDPVLPDGKRVYRPLIPRRHHHHRPMYGYGYEYGSEYVVPPHPLPQQDFYGMHDSECPTPVEENFQRPFLSDEALPSEASTGRHRQR
jgi:type II secretory pathway component GspD/PulD (secretin)